LRLISRKIGSGFLIIIHFVKKMIIFKFGC